MATQQHLQASNLIKGVHKKLREEASLLGVEAAWKKHCIDEEILKQYASAMHDLAANHWENNYKTNSNAFSRIEWVYNFCKDYFSEEGISKCRKKEIEIAKKLDLTVSTRINKNIPPYKLLDVGSCYNPMNKYDIFDVVAIDIAPATSDVYKCDFLNLTITNTKCNTANCENITELETESFDVVLFSLLLEYMPSPKQRLLACSNAYRLLANEGILFIITPDSKHVGANAKIMKSWRVILAKIGFSRIKYEKLAYLHCMAFRKSCKVEIPLRWAFLQNEKDFFTELVIPQDFQNTSDNCKEEMLIFPNCDVELFNELPFPDF